jgi:m7GpppX diphosphatase
MTHCNWIYDILDEKKEKELRVFENEHFMLQKDIKFNEGDDIQTLYCLAIPKQRDLKSIRDLNASHLPLLKSMLEECYPAMEKMFGLKKNKFKPAFFHYQPTYYHLHVHFIHVVATPHDNSVSLEQVIFNIEMASDYY